MQTLNLENRIEKIEVKLDDINQENILDSLVFSGLKQKLGVDLKPTWLNVLSIQTGVTSMSSGKLSSVFWFRMSGPHTAKVARKVFSRSLN